MSKLSSLPKTDLPGLFSDLEVAVRPCIADQSEEDEGDEFGNDFFSDFISHDEWEWEEGEKIDDYFPPGRNLAEEDDFDIFECDEEDDLEQD